MGQASNELRELMRQNLFNELSSFFTNEEEGRRISAQMEDKFFQNSKSQEEYLTAFMKHLEQLKTLKQEAQAQSMAAVQSNPPPPEPKKPPPASLPATIVPAMADARSRSAEIIDYLTQCQKKISPAVLESIVDSRQKAFFELLIKEIHSVRSALEQGMLPTHPDLGPRIKIIVEKVRAINKSQQIHLQQQNLRQQIQLRRPATAMATTPAMSRQVSVAQAVPDALAATTSGTKRKRKPPISGDNRRAAPTKQAKSVSAPSTPSIQTPLLYSSRPAVANVTKASQRVDAFDQNAFLPGINGFFEQLSKFDKKPKMNQLKQSALRIMSMLQYIRTREGFEAAEVARRASIRKNQPNKSASAPVTPPTPAPPATLPDKTAGDTLLESVSGQNLLAAEILTASADQSIPDSGLPPFQRELEQIQNSGLFTITILPRKHPSWRLLRFDLNFSSVNVPCLLVGIRNDYNEQECVSSCSSGPSSCLDKIDYRAQKGNSSLTDQNILQIDALLRKCMLQRRPCLYDLVCTWHRAIKHVFSTDHQAQA